MVVRAFVPSVLELNCPFVRAFVPSPYSLGLDLSLGLGCRWRATEGSVLHAFWFKRGPRPPIGFAKGGPIFFKEGPFFVVEILISFEEFGGQFCVYCAPLVHYVRYGRQTG